MPYRPCQICVKLHNTVNFASDYHYFGYYDYHEQHAIYIDPIHKVLDIEGQQLVHTLCTVCLSLIQMLDLEFDISPTTLHTTSKTTVLYAWLLLEPCSVQPLTDTAVRTEDNGIIQMEVLYLPARMGHFSSHLELTKED